MAEGDITPLARSDEEIRVVDTDVKPVFEHLNLRYIHDLLIDKVKGEISDPDQVESAMSKTPNGYILEVIYKGTKYQHLQ